MKGDRKYRLVKDHLGSVRLVVDTHDGAVVKRLDYDVSGMVIGESGDFDLLFGFAGGFRDTDTGLTKFGARWYDPEVGRWTSKEPLGFNGSSNFYTYANNDPVNFVDPTGKIPLPAFIVVVLAGAATNVILNYDSSKSFYDQAGNLAVKAVIGGSATAAGMLGKGYLLGAALMGGIADYANQQHDIAIGKREETDWRSVGISGTTSMAGGVCGNFLGAVFNPSVGAVSSVIATGTLDYNRESALGWAGDQFNNLINWAKNTMSPVIEKSQNQEY